MSAEKQRSDLSNNEDEQQSSNARSKHVVFFVHGLGANPRELEYVKDSMSSLLQEGEQDDIRFICDNSNTGNTKDGFDQGGQRLAEAITRELSENYKEDSVNLSLIGYSVGGNFCRSAVRHLTLDEQRVTPLLFCTIASPHLGLGKQTGLPSWLETTMSWGMGATGKDLNLATDAVQEMATSDTYLAPLSKFRTRLAVANAFNTDFAVPVSTAGFLSPNSSYPHHVVTEDKTMQRDANHQHCAHLLTVITKPGDHDGDDDNMTQRLDALGWTKIFLDLRSVMPGPRIPTFSCQDASVPLGVPQFTSSELHNLLNQSGKTRKLPLGHPIGIASQKHGIYRRLSKSGTPYAERLAHDLVTILQNEGKSHFCRSVETEVTEELSQSENTLIPTTPESTNVAL